MKKFEGLVGHKIHEENRINKYVVWCIKWTLKCHLMYKYWYAKMELL